MFLPITRKECKNLGWNKLDIIFVTGDAYIDSPYSGVAILGKLLVKNGYQVGVISQPDLYSDKDILHLGIPKLLWAVTAGSVDSMVANYTPLKKKRKSDDFTPGGINNRRPDRATIKYVNLIKRYDKEKTLISIGGIEASLRRVAHYDYWSDSIKRSVLLDSKADILMYGMSEKTMLQLAKYIQNKEDFYHIRGICYISNKAKKDYILLPSFEDIIKDKNKFIQMMKIFYSNQDSLTGKGLLQKFGKRYIIHNPPQFLPSEAELDSYYELEYEYDVHPEIKKKGNVKGIETIKNSITINRGCYGECNFCSITLHQGATVICRSVKSVLKEIELIKKGKNFNGIINDLGGPTANMYGFECEKKVNLGKCKDKRCIFPKICSKMKVSHNKLIKLLRQVRNIEGIKKVFIRSGLRYEFILKDKKWGDTYLKELVKYHISGQLKIAPEHLDDNILKLMGKPSNSILEEFIRKFYRISKNLNKNFFLTYYIIVAHPGCDVKKAKTLRKDIIDTMKTIPEQVQIYTPLPLTWSSVMYYTMQNPFTGKKITVINDLKTKAFMKAIFSRKKHKNIHKREGYFS